MNQPEGEKQPTSRASFASIDMAEDPVCKMEVDRSTAHNHYEYKGKTYYICSAYCLGMFCSEPAKYAQS